MLFADRSDAGKRLLELLAPYKDLSNTVVLGLARGGVVVAAEVASALHLPLNVVVIRKIGAPFNPELAIGAIGEHGGVFNEELIRMLGVSEQYLKQEVARQREMLKARLLSYRGKDLPLDLKGKRVILVDDGIATGASFRAAIQSVRDAGAQEVICAVPVAAPDSLKKIAAEVDACICLFSPSHFEAVGSFYRSFGQTSEEEVIQLLRAFHS